MAHPVSATKLLIILPLVAALAYLALVGLMYFSQRALLYPGAGAAFAPASRAEWGEKVAIATPDGETLHALFSKGEAGKPSVLFFLGNADRVGNYGFLAQALACARHRPAGGFLSRLSRLDRLAKRRRAADRRHGGVRLALSAQRRRR